MRTHRIVLFHTTDLAVSAPFEVTDRQLNQLRDYCEDNDYKFVPEDLAYMSSRHVDDVLADAKEFWDSVS